MKGISFDNLRVGHKYKLVNYTEVYEFIVEYNLGNNNYKLKDLYTLEIYEMHDLVKFGKGEDFEIREL